MHLRYRAFFAFIAFALGLVLGACQLFLNDDATSCSTDGDCTSRYGGSVCVEGLCHAPTALDGSTDAPAAPLPPECTTNLECSDRLTALALQNPPVSDGGASDASLDAPATDGRVPAVCVQSVGKCAALLSEDCTAFSGDYLNDDAIVLGSMFLVTGSAAPSNIPRQYAVQLATEELNSAVGGNGIPSADGGPRRPLLTLSCDEVVNATRASQHLVNDLHVPAIIGPARGEDVTTFTQNLTAQAGTLIMSPSATPSAITDLVDNGLTWRLVPSDAQRAPLFIREINEVETALKAVVTGRNLRLAIAFRNDALGASNRDALVSGLQFNGQFLTLPPNSGVGGAVSLDQYDFTDPNAQRALALKYATEFKPDILVVVANEVVTIPVEYEKQRILAADTMTPKAYLIGNDVAKIPAWYTPAKTILGANYEDFRKRVRGFGVRPDGNSISVNSNFLAAYLARYPGVDTSSSAIAASYDATYAVAYGIAAAASSGGPLTGAAIAKGLSSLGSGETIPVGVINANKAMQSLAGGTSISLVGTLSALKWDVKGDIVGGTLESWCVNPTGSGFASAGETFDVFGRTFSGSYVACP